MIAPISGYDKSVAFRSFNTRWIGLANVNPTPFRPPRVAPRKQEGNGFHTRVDDQRSTLARPISP